MKYLRSGRPSVDLAWTVRFRNVWPTEVLVDEKSLGEWLEGTYPGVLFATSIDMRDLLNRLRDLREAVYALLMASVRDEQWSSGDWLIVNRAAMGTRFSHRLGATAPMPTEATDADQVLAEIAIDAIDVLAAERSRLKLCEGPLCALPFLDESRGATRRWCATQRCGNRVNTKAYRNRSRR